MIVCRDDELVARGRALELDQVIVGAVGGEDGEEDAPVGGERSLTTSLAALRAAAAAGGFGGGAGEACRGFLIFFENRVAGILNMRVS